MEQKDQWEKFTDTGKVADYLAYCRQAGQMSAGALTDGSSLGMAVAKNVMWGDSVNPREVMENAGNHDSNGDDLTDITAQRIR